jgi:hypothetical protein
MVDLGKPDEVIQFSISSITLTAFTTFAWRSFVDPVLIEITNVFSNNSTGNNVFLSVRGMLADGNNPYILVSTLQANSDFEGEYIRYLLKPVNITVYINAAGWPSTLDFLDILGFVWYLK